MKKILGILFLLALMAFKTNLQAQTCSSVIATLIGPIPQGTQESYGVKVTLAHTYTQGVTVNGTIGDNGYMMDGWQLVIPAGSLTAQTGTDYYYIPEGRTPTIEISNVTPCPPSEITGTYAGVTIAYEISNSILRFNSAQDISIVLNQLEDDYELHNDNYEAQYPNLTADELDSMDTQTGFDEFKPFKDFENLFSGFSSKRAEIQNTEITWLNNNFAGLDPDDIDLTFDDAQNTIFNGANSFKIGSDFYQLTSAGLSINETLVSKRILNDYRNGISKNDGIVTNGIFQNVGYNVTEPALVYSNYSISNEVSSVCKTNKKKKSSLNYDNNSRRFELKVAIHSIFIRSGVHGKIIHFKSKNGNWKRSRTEMAVTCGGTIYNGLCLSSFQFADRKPYSDFKKRKQLATRRHNQFDIPSESRTVWKTDSGAVASGFDTPGGTISGVLVLTF